MLFCEPGVSNGPMGYRLAKMLRLCSANVAVQASAGWVLTKLSSLTSDVLFGKQKELSQISQYM